MSSIGFSYTPDLVPFLEIISDTFYIPKKQTPAVIMVTKWLLEDHERTVNVQNFELRYIDDCGVYYRVFRCFKHCGYVIKHFRRYD